MYYVYIIKSLKRNYRYVGISDNPERRISQHNKGHNRTTRAYLPFKTLLIENFENRVDAREKEKYYKSGIGREYLSKNIDI